MSGLQCAKRLYLDVHRKDERPPLSPSEEARVEQGNRVGEEARRRFERGVLIDAEPWQWEEAVVMTRAALESPETGAIFEGSWISDEVGVRVDVLRRRTDGLWDLIEVKSGSSVKDQYLADAAVQLWVLEKAGIAVASVRIMHINSNYVHPEGALLVETDVTQDVRRRTVEVPKWVAEQIGWLAGEAVPVRAIGPHCGTPYGCPWKEKCWAEAKVPTPSVLDLYKGGKDTWDFYRQGVVRLDDPKLPSMLKDAEKIQLRMIEVARTGKRYLDRRELRKAVTLWKWPLAFLDFETLGPAIPLWVGLKPYEQVPFQFSLDIQKAPGDPVSAAVHHEYLHRDAGDPRAGVARALAAALPAEGDVVAYNAAFEGACLERLAAAAPDVAPALLSARARLVDPLPVLRAAVYDAAFCGSFSIKSVAPALLGDRWDYSKLEVGDGLQAQLAFSRMIETDDVGERQALRESLLKYCAQDTAATVEIVGWMVNEVDGP